MAIGPLEFQGAIPRTQDFAIQKHNEDAKGLVDQANVTQETTREVTEKATNVNKSEETSNDREHFDAREKGSNEYGGDGGKKRKKPGEGQSEGKVIVKGMPGSFDIRI